MGQLKTVDPGPLGPLAPVGMPKRVAPIGCCKTRPSAMVFACGRLWCHGAAGVVARRRLGTRLGLAGGGPIAFALPAHARAAGTQNPGGFAPKNLSNNHEIHAIEQCKFANRPRARAASRDRSIEQESMMSEEKS